MLNDFLMSQVISNSKLGQKIQNSDNISQRNTYVLDAIEKNPNIEGTMAKNIKDIERVISNAKIGINDEVYETLGDSIRGQIEKYQSAVVSDTEPEHANVWINTENNNDDVSFIPEINDDIVSKEDTWSSDKINSKFDKLVGDMSEKGISAVNVPVDFVPTSNGNDSWDWRPQQGRTPKYRSNFGLVWLAHTNELMLDIFNNDIELAAQSYAKHDFIVMQILNLKLYADSRPTLSENSLKIIKRAKEINPRFRVFQYIQSESVRFDFLYNGENSYLNSDGSWEGSTADLSGCTKIYNKQQLIDWLDYFAEIGTDGVFWDDWGYDLLEPICYQMGYDVSSYSTKNEALNQKWTELIELSHERGLAVITNGGFPSDVGNWYTHLNDDDVIALESCLMSTYGHGYWNNGQILIYNIYKNFISTNMLKAKLWTIDYLPADVNNTLLDKIYTFEIAMVLATGCNYVSIGTFNFIKKPWFVDELIIGETYEITQITDYIYRITNGEHFLEVYKDSTLNGAIVTTDTIDKCYCNFDGHLFKNAFIESPYLDLMVSNKIETIEDTINTFTGDTKKNAQSYWRLAIDDWKSNLSFLDFTNYLKTRSSFDYTGGDGSGMISGRIVKNDEGGIDLVYTFSNCTGSRNPMVSCFSPTDIEDLELIDKTLEFGFSNVVFDLTGYTGYEGNTDLTTLVGDLYDGTGYQWSYPGLCIYFEYGDGNYTFNPPSNVTSKIGLPGGYATQKTGIAGTPFKLYCWISSSTVFNGTVTIKNIYCVNIDEYNDEILKTWYTNIYPSSINVFSAFQYVFNNNQIYGHDVIDVSVTSNDPWGWCTYQFDGESVIAMRGHTFEFGCMEMTLSNGETGRPLSDGTNWAFGVGIDGFIDNMPNPNTYRLYTDTIEQSAIWNMNIPCIRFTVPEDATDIVIGVQSYGFPSGVTMEATGAYLYDLDEKVFIRGEASTNASLKVCRVTDELEQSSPSKVPNALYMSDSGKMWCTKLDGTIINFSEINDETVGVDNTWSSSKTNSEIGGIKSELELNSNTISGVLEYTEDGRILNLITDCTKVNIVLGGKYTIFGYTDKNITFGSGKLNINGTRICTLYLDASFEQSTITISANSIIKISVFTDDVIVALIKDIDCFNMNSYMESAINQLKSSVFTLEENKAEQTEVDSLKSELDDYIDKEKIISKGNELGYYALENGNVLEKEHSSWTRLHITKPFAFNSIRFTIGTQIKCVFVVIDEYINAYENVGNYDVDVSNASDIYLNFFGANFVEKYYLYYGYKPYEDGFINFHVKINQHTITTDNTENALLDNENNLNNVTCYIKLPVSYRPYGKKTKLLMVCHGAGMGVTIANPSTGIAWETYNHYQNLVNTFVDAGYAVFDCNGYNETFFGCNFWGAHRGVEAWRKAYDYVVKNYNVEDNVSIYGFSMGGLTALNLVLNGFSNVKCIALGSPVLDVEKCWEDGNTAQMKEAYGMGDVYEADKVVGSSPITRIVEIDNTDYCFGNIPPIKVWYGSTEVGTAVNKNYAIRLVNAMRNSGTYAIYREVNGAGHDICFGANANCNKEYLYWINRFNN